MQETISILGELALLTLIMASTLVKTKLSHFTREQISDSTSGIFATSSSSKSVLSSKHSSDCPNVADCGFHKPGSGVVLSCLDCFLAGGSLYRFEYGISRPTFIVKLRGGTCTTADSDAAVVVIHRAMHLLQNGFGRYNVFENNCEDFALYCKTGLLILDKGAPGRSGQVSGLIGAPLAAILSLPLQFLMSNPIGIATAGAGFYYVNKYVTDIGVRTDVIRMEVEDMVSFIFSEAPQELDKDPRKRMPNGDGRGNPASSKRQMRG